MLSPARKLGYIGLGIIMTGVAYYLIWHEGRVNTWILILISNIGMYICGKAVQKSKDSR